MRARTILIEQKWVDGEIVPGQKTNRPPRFPPLLDVLRADLHDYELAHGRRRGLIFARANGAPWRDHDWRDWRSRVWQPACEAVGLATINNTTIIKDGRRKTKRTYNGPVPYDLRHSFASPADPRRQALDRADRRVDGPQPSHPAHPLRAPHRRRRREADPAARAINAARETQPTYTTSSSTTGNGHGIAQLLYA